MGKGCLKSIYHGFLGIFGVHLSEGKGRRRRQTDEDVLDMMREHRPGKRKSDKAFDKKSDKKSDKKFEKKGSDRKRSDKSEKKSKGLFGKERTFKKNDIDKKTGKAKKWK